MGIVGQGIQEQVGGTVASQMFRQRDIAGLDQALGVDAVARCFPLQIGADVRGRRFSNNTLPGTCPSSRIQTVEHRPGDLPAVVGATEDKTALRQAGFGARGRCRDNAIRIGGKDRCAADGPASR